MTPLAVTITALILAAALVLALGTARTASRTDLDDAYAAEGLELDALARTVEHEHHAPAERP